MISDSYSGDLELTDEQVKAVECELGPVMVVAGAGSGKTSVVARRFIHLHNHFGIDPSRILCITFTNSGVRSMREKIETSDYEFSQQFKENINVMTFHSLCKQILVSIAKKKAGGTVSKFVHASRYMAIVKDILKGYPHIKAAYDTCSLLEKLRWLCKFKGRDFTKDDLVQVGIRYTDVFDREKLLKKFPYSDIREIYHSFDQEMERRQWLTLDDIILEARKCMLDEEVVNEWCSKFDAIICDEFQDVDEVQFDILTKLCKGKNNLFCVGDPDQSIYGFRGALPKIFSRLQEYYAKLGMEVKVKKLEKNFRSTPQILDVANKLINLSNSNEEYRKILFTDNAPGPIPTLNFSRTSKEQAEQVVKRVEELKSQGVSKSKIMILGRNQSHYESIKSFFVSSSIHFDDWKDIGESTFEQRQECKDLIHWINVAFIQNDPKRWVKSFRRVYARPSLGVGTTTFLKFMDKGAEGVIDRMEELSSTNSRVAVLLRKVKDIQSVANDSRLSLCEKCSLIAEKSGIIFYYKRNYGENSHRIETIQSFLNSSSILESDSWEEALSHFNTYLYGDSEDRLKFSTIHGVKGAEFDHVFVVSLSEGNLPSRRGLRICQNDEEKDNYKEEERRLLYVALTRARKTLSLFVDKPTSSEFIDDINVEGEKAILNISSTANLNGGIGFEDSSFSRDEA